MAIPSRQIGWSTKANLLWQISKQLQQLTCVTAGGCGPTTTTTTTSASTNYNVAGCERMEYHVITYNGEGVLPEGTIVNNATPECWYIIDQTTEPADVGVVEYVWPTLGECQPCIDSHTTTTTTTTAPLVNTNSTFVDCEGACDAGPCAQPYNYFDVWMTQECIDTFPTIGCQVWLDDKATIPFPNGSYNDGTGIGCIYITNGTISSTPPPVFTDTTFINCPGYCFAGCITPYDYYAVYMSQACIDSWPTEGCEVWLDANATEPFPTGSYPSLTGCIDIENGIVI